MANPWFRMYSDFIYNPTVEFLSFEDQRHFVFILCMKNEGLLDKQYPQPGMLERVVSRRLGLIGEAFENAKRRIKEVGLIDDNWQPVNWNSRQFISDADVSNAERQRRYRERKKGVTHNVTRNVTVTGIEEDTETNTESEPEEETEEEQNTPSSPSLAALCCQQMRAQGIAQCNPSHPTLLALIEAGATEEEFEQAAKAAVSKGKSNFAYALAIVKRQREEAAKLVLHRGRLPNKQEALEQSNRAATAGWMPPELKEAKNAN